MRSRGIAVGLGLLGGALALAAATRGWVAEPVPGLPAASAVIRTGAELVPGVPALALAAAACAVVLGTAGRAVRLVSAVLLVLASVGMAATILTGLDPGLDPGLDLGLGGGAGGGLGGGRTVTGWPWLALAGAVLAALAGLLALARSHTWPAPARRYERSAREQGTPAATDDWTSLSQGHDPT